MSGRVVCIRAGEPADVPAAAPVEPIAPARLALGHRLGLGCLGLIVAVWFLAMVVILRNKSA